jgi:hypothetical protein
MGKVKSLLLVIFQELWVWNREFSLLRRKILLLDAYMEDGKYEFVYKSKNLAVIKNERIESIPNTLNTTISELWNKPVNILNGKNALTIVRNFLIKIRNILDSSDDYLTFEKGPNFERKANAQVALVRSNGKTVLFDLNKNLVYIKFPGICSVHNSKSMRTPESREYASIIQEINKYFFIPNDEDATDCFHCQEFVDGVSISSLDFTNRIKVVRDICSSSINMLKKNSLKTLHSSSDLVNDGFDITLSNIDDIKMLQFIESRKNIITDLSKGWSLVPSYCDLTAHNTTILNGHAFLLDLAPHKVGFLPAFFSPICLIHSEVKEYDRYDLINYFLDGGMDIEFSTLSGDDTLNLHSRIDLLLAETVILVAIGCKIKPENVQYWFDPIFKLVQEKGILQ